MADHGEVLTKFEEIFGTLVEHEVIKLVLQSCDWETGKASETLLGMIDENDLPPHILNAILANNIINGTVPSLADVVPEVAPVGELAAQPRNDATEIEDIISHRAGSEGRGASPANAMTPLSWAAVTVQRDEERTPGGDKQTQSFSPSVRPKNKRELEIESDASSPSMSPLKTNREQDTNGTCIQDTSRWAMAPEFVPNAFSQKPLNLYSNVWPAKSSHSPSPEPQQQPHTKPKLSPKEEIVSKIVKGVKILVLMRGLPGSGKSSVAHVIKGRTGVVLSTDDFFYNRHSEYHYDPSKLSEAHGWNKQRALVKVKEGRSPVIIDNTNLQVWEMKPYIKLALHHGYEVELLEPETPWRYSPKELARRNVHGVTKQKISDMKDHFDLNVKIESVINSLKITQMNGSCEQQEDLKPSQKLKSKQVNTMTKKGSKLHNEKNSQRNDISGCGQGNDDDADVIVEGYEDDEDLPHCSPVCSPSKAPRPPSREVVNATKPSTPTVVLESNGDAGQGNDGEEVSDEDRIRALLEEASDNVDDIETDWDDLALQATGDVDDSHFNDLVSSFGVSVREQLERSSRAESEASRTSTMNGEDTHEDAAMYELCSNMEEKMGKPLSSLLRPNSSKDCSNSVINNFSQVTTGVPDNQDTSLFSLVSLSEVTPKSAVDNSADTKGTVNSLSENMDIQDIERNYVNQNGNIQEHEKNIDTSPCKSTMQSTNCGEPVDSLVSWECVDPGAGVSSMNWDSQGDKPNDNADIAAKPSRNRRNRTPGDPMKWLKAGEPEEKDLAWEPVQNATESWGTSDQGAKGKQSLPDKTTGEESSLEPQPHTGAVPKFRRQKRHSKSPPSGASNSPCPPEDMLGRDSESPTIWNESSQVNPSYKENETQTRSIDFEALQLDNNLYEQKILYGQLNYKPTLVDIPTEGPLTKGILRLDKGTMTENQTDTNEVKPLQNLSAFFPNIPEEDLRDVLQKCKYNLDWAMNVLLDSGYEMTDSPEINTSQDEEYDVDADIESTVETASTGDGVDDRSSFADCSDVSADMLLEDRTKRMKQSQDPAALACKKEIEASFGLPDTVDDRLKRLTGKEFGELNTTKVKQNKNKRRHNSKKDKLKVEGPAEVSSGDEIGAQYVTLVMDPLFASQLVNMFGPPGSCGPGGDLVQDDRSVILPLELCHQIHKFWSDTLDGKFSQEAEVLDSLIRQDENLARRLQEEENSGASTSDDRNNDMDDDAPTNLREIMALEQALQESKDIHCSEMDDSISNRLNLQRLMTEYPHVDPDALREEFASSGNNYRDTVQILCTKYGAEKGTPKTVIAPEAMYRYEQQMIRQAQQESLAMYEKQKQEREEAEYEPDDPQVYRDEARMHYEQRQEAFRKAQEADRNGMKAVAAYYARIGNLHATKLIEANQRASAKILQAVNCRKKGANTIDLHLLHVGEATSAAQAFLKERVNVLRSTRGTHDMKVFLITGRGNHSVGGQARLKPAIKEFLKNNGYQFHEVNSGMLAVSLKAASD